MAAAAGNVELVWGDAMKVDLAGLDPAPDPDGRQPAVLDRDAADPAHDRRASVGGAVDGHGPARDRRPAAARRPARARTAGRRVLVQLACSVKLLRGVDRAVFTPRPRVDSALLGSGGRARARPPSWSALVRGAFAHRRKTLAGSARACRGSRTGDEARAALEAAGLDPAARAEALAPGGLPPPRRAVGFLSRCFARPPSSTCACASGPQAGRAPRAALAVLLACPGRPDRDRRAGDRRRRGRSARGSRGRTSSRRAGGAARARVGRAAAAGGDRQAHPGRGRAGGRQRRRGGGAAASRPRSRRSGRDRGGPGRRRPVAAPARVLARGAAPARWSSRCRRRASSPWC